MGARLAKMEAPLDGGGGGDASLLPPAARAGMVRRLLNDASSSSFFPQPRECMCFLHHHRVETDSLSRCFFVIIVASPKRVVVVSLTTKLSLSSISPFARANRNRRPAATQREGERRNGLQKPSLAVQIRKLANGNADVSQSGFL